MIFESFAYTGIDWQTRLEQQSHKGMDHLTFEGGGGVDDFMRARFFFLRSFWAGYFFLSWWCAGYIFFLYVSLQDFSFAIL